MDDWETLFDRADEYESDIETVRAVLARRRGETDA
jgi:hypothetical protein